MKCVVAKVQLLPEGCALSMIRDNYRVGQIIQGIVHLLFLVSLLKQLTLRDIDGKPEQYTALQ